MEGITKTTAQTLYSQITNFNKLCNLSMHDSCLTREGGIYIYRSVKRTPHEKLFQFEIILGKDLRLACYVYFCYDLGLNIT